MPVPSQKKAQRNALRVRSVISSFFVPLFPSNTRKLQFIRTVAKSGPKDPLRSIQNYVGEGAPERSARVKQLIRGRIVQLRYMNPKRKPLP